MGQTRIPFQNELSREALSNPIRSLPWTESCKRYHALLREHIPNSSLLICVEVYGEEIRLTEDFAKGYGVHRDVPSALYAYFTDMQRELLERGCPRKDIPEFPIHPPREEPSLFSRGYFT